MKKHFGRARYAAITVLAIVAVVLFVRLETIRSTRAQNAPAPSPAALELAAALCRAGLDPAPLAAGGVTSASVGALADNALEYLAAQPGVLDQADIACGEAAAECDQLLQLIRAGMATPQQLEGYPGAKVALAQATAQRQAAVQDFFDAATAGFTAAQRNTLTSVRGNRKWELPVEFLVVDRSEPQWLQLRDALANERVAAKLGQPPDPGAQAALAEFRSHPLVAAAKANLDASLDVVTTAWEQAIAQDDAPPE